MECNGMQWNAMECNEWNEVADMRLFEYSLLGGGQHVKPDYSVGTIVKTRMMLIAVCNEWN